MIAGRQAGGEDGIIFDPRVIKTRAALAEAVLALAAEKPFADVTVTEIAVRAGVGYASFFRHYKDKDALLSDVAERLVDDLIGIIMPAMQNDDTAVAAAVICRYVDEHRSISRALLAGGAETTVRRHIVARAIEHSKTRNVQPRDVPNNLLATHSVAATLGLLAWWLEQGGDISADAMARIVDRLVMGPVRAMQRA
jgi:AcrR family transcriptional regulator